MINSNIEMVRTYRADNEIDRNDAKSLVGKFVFFHDYENGVDLIGGARLLILVNTDRFLLSDGSHYDCIVGFKEAPKDRRENTIVVLRETLAAQSEALAAQCEALVALRGSLAAQSDDPEPEFVGCLSCALTACDCSEDEIVERVYPSFLLEMSKQMNRYDSSSIDDPIWHVCSDTHQPCSEGHRPDGFTVNTCTELQIYCSDDRHGEDFISRLRENYPDVIEKYESNFILSEDHKKHGPGELMIGLIGYHPWQLLDDGEFQEAIAGTGLEIRYYRNARMVEKTCLTKEAAEDFIERNQRDWDPLYLSCQPEGACPQMVELINWVKGLTK